MKYYCEEWRRDNRWQTRLKWLAEVLGIHFLPSHTKRHNALSITASTAVCRRQKDASSTLTLPAKNEKIISHILRFIGCQVIGENTPLTKGMRDGVARAGPYQSFTFSVTNLFPRQHTRRKRNHSTVIVQRPHSSQQLNSLETSSLAC